MNLILLSEVNNIAYIISFLEILIIWVPIICCIIKLFKKIFSLIDILIKYLELKVDDIERKEK